MTTLLWMECGACSGESMAILGAEGPGKEATICSISWSTMTCNYSGIPPSRWSLRRK